MSLTGSFLPPARQLQRESHLVQEHIRKKQQKQDFEQTIKAQLQHKHAQRRQKILVVANRLPTKPIRDSEGKWSFERCSGGLVSCLAGIQAKFDMVWLGWPGSEFSDADKDMVAAEAMKVNCYPVFLPQDLINDYYNGFANNVLWPLFHYIMPPFDKGVNECSTAQWEAYKKANELFVEAILQVYEDDDYVWVHDYHLMLVPKMLRDMKPDSNIGWFLHTPFPSAEIYRTLPWRQEIIESLLHANLLGFHVYDYLRHFLSACVQLTSLEISAHSVDATSIGGCIVTCATVPIGISPVDFTEALELPEVRQQIEKLHVQYGGRKVILGIDRLDYMKGIPHKLMAFGCFLDMHPDWASNCVLVQLAVPSRRDVPEYQRLQRQVHELVGQICGKHSKLETGVPVIYLDATMSFLDLVALYRVADVALITSLRDGMNLVSYEFIACHKNREPPGVLILSEFAGAAQSLGAGAIRVNPWNLQDTANAIYEALEMLPEDRTALQNYAYQYVQEHTSQKWAETFLQCLQEACSDLMEVTAEVPPLLPYEELLTEWSDSAKRLIIIDLLECLVPAKKRRSLHAGRRPKTVSLPAELRQCLQTISSSASTKVVITTDKSRHVLDSVAGDLPVFLAPEGCCVYRRPGETEWIQLVEDGQVEGCEEWMEGVKVVFDYFHQRTPGSYTEKQEYQYRWYWENAQFDFGSAQAREVLIHLWAGPLVNSEAEVVVGDRSITVRPHACSRSACMERLLINEVGEAEMQALDFAMCFAVVSHRDEDVFETLQNLLDDPQQEESMPSNEVSEAGEESPRPCGDPNAPASVEPGLHTPPGPAPLVKPGEPPPAYDWVPTAQREPHREPPAPVPEEPLPALQLPGSAASDDRPSYCACYTLSLGMKKTKAQHTLPHPYHVQNLIRAMAARLPQRPEEGGAAK
mmetsp:Transcript_110252/g.322683  ORF Transcript_110252/g.322683 Transcript_110252/m.322683 type:complete len:922 (+) Transcript_110252:137-2902(+)